MIQNKMKQLTALQLEIDPSQELVEYRLSSVVSYVLYEFMIYVMF